MNKAQEEMMALSERDSQVVEHYLGLVGNGKGKEIRVAMAEIGWILRNGAELEMARREMLTALQKAFSRQKEDSTTERLKDALTNVIIMQTRINDRWKALLQLLEEAAKEGEEKVKLDALVLRKWGEAAVEAYRHMEERSIG